jgi:hypothetical protein
VVFAGGQVIGERGNNFRAGERCVEGLAAEADQPHARVVEARTKQARPLRVEDLQKVRDVFVG